jgi:hypothetical protein
MQHIKLLMKLFYEALGSMTLNCSPTQIQSPFENSWKRQGEGFCIINLAKDKTCYKFLWFQTFLKMTKKEQKENHLNKMFTPNSHMSSFNMLSSTTQVAMSIQNFETIVIVTWKNHSITNVYMLGLIHIKIQ